MGVNTAIIVVNPLENNGLDISKILKGLHVPTAIEQENLDFETTLGCLWDQASIGDLAATIYKGKVILIDDAHYIDIGNIPPFTAAYNAEVLQIEHSDTVDAGEFSFWKADELVRKVSSGSEAWMDEFIEEGITDEQILSPLASIDIGTPQEFEKESSHPMDVLASYALDYLVV
jgi:hypothetical protein